MRNTESSNARNNEVSKLKQLLADAKSEERRARAEVMASRILNLANHIRANKLEINEVLDLLFQESETYRHQAMELY